MKWDAPEAVRARCLVLSYSLPGAARVRLELQGDALDSAMEKAIGVLVRASARFGRVSRVDLRLGVA